MQIELSSSVHLYLRCDLNLENGSSGGLKILSNGACSLKVIYKNRSNILVKINHIAITGRHFSEVIFQLNFIKREHED